MRDTALCITDGVRTPIVRALAAAGVRPNHVTIFGALVAVGAGIVASQGYLAIAGVVFLAGSLMDGLDGALARHTGAVSRFGAFLDSVLDRVGEGALFLGIAAYLAQEGDQLGVVLAFAAALASFLVSYARARAEGLGIHGAGRIIAPRPVRVVILAGALLVSQPVIGVGVVVLLAGVSVAQRIMTAWRYQETDGE